MDVLDLARRLKAEIMDYNAAAESASFLVRAGRFLGKPFAVALLAWQRRKDFDLFYFGSEAAGLLVAALFKFVNSRPRLVIGNHHLSQSKKAFLFRHLRLQNTIDAFVCLNEYQATFLEKKLAVSPPKVFRVHYGALVDGSFFRPEGEGVNGKAQYVLSVGRESRDYHTLFEALIRSNIPAKIVSSGMRDINEYSNDIASGMLHNVEKFDHISYAELRNLYNGCAFVVIPLHNVDYPAGITAVMEAMAMGKAVIATYSRGIHEFIDDAVTGFWVEPGNPRALQEKMLLLWNNPALAREIGIRARESAKRRVDLTRYLDEIVSIVITRARL
jgi:glycosyltransferase involved in cell wall biosynthesis